MTKLAAKKFAAPRFILASASPRRKFLLTKARYSTVVVPSQVKERTPSGMGPAQIVRYLALKKAVSVSKKHPRDVVLGADTLVFINGHVVGKPKNARHAKRMLAELSGAWQKVYTGVAVVWEGGRRRRSGVSLTHVKMRTLSQDQITRASRRHLDKAGSYAVQEKNDPFVERMRGDYDNVVGLPMRLVRQLLRFRDRRRHGGGETLLKAVR